MRIWPVSWLFVAMSLPALHGCAAQQVEKPTVVWPLPPATPRIKFIQAFARDDDLDLSTWQEFSRAVAGVDDRLRLIQPTGVAVSADGHRVYVSCGAAGLVLRFDFLNKSVERIASEEGYAVEHPYDIELDAQENVYISDSRKGGVMVYSRANEFLRKLGEGMFDRPTGIAIDTERGLIYAADGSKKDSDHHAVEVFKLDGEHLRTIGTRGVKEGQFFFPVYLAVHPDGRLFVGDAMNHRIQVFDRQGAFVQAYGKQGNNPGDFGLIKGMAFDAYGNLHVVDGHHAVVQIFNDEFGLLMHYGGRANRVEYFDMPTAIHVSADNRIYVANFVLARVNVYELINTEAADSYRLDAGPRTDTPAEAAPASVAPAPSSPAPEPAPQPAPEPAPQPAPEPAPQPAPEPEPQPEPAPPSP